MPFIYGVVPGVLQTTNVTPLTENDCFFVKPGVRGVGLLSLYFHGKGASLTALSSITARLKKWFTTAASAGIAITPSPLDPGAQAAKSTAAYAVGAVTAGTGGPTLMGSVGFGAAGPATYVAENADAMPVLEGGANMSLDVFISSGVTNMNFEMSAKIQE